MGASSGEPFILAGRFARMPQTILSHTFDNGLTLVAEPMSSVESAAFTILVPAGAGYDAEGKAGLASLTSEMLLRGAGERDSRQLVNDLDNLGVERGENVSTAHSSFSGATLAENLFPALAIYADVLRRPHLPEDKLEPCRQVILQELYAVEDEPPHKLMQELRKLHFAPPYGRPPQGEIEGVEAVEMNDVRGSFARLFRPGGAILGVAGKIDWPRLKDLVGELLGDWPQKQVPELAPAVTRSGNVHIDYEANQTQIGIAYESVPYRDPDYFHAAAGVGVLSSGMSARLFTEVREKRGLCYSVYASYQTTREVGAVLCYAGTTAERAQETLDVTLGELKRLTQGIEEDELDRLKARIKSSLIMQQESSSARTSAIVRDWYHLGRVRTLDEIAGIVDGLTRESINRYLAANPPKEFTIATLGPAALTLP
jgi:predicted Zn-dependent peptidase